MENHLKKMPSPLLSLVPILVLVALLFVTIRTFGSDALSGGSQVVLTYHHGGRLPFGHDLLQSQMGVI